MIYLKNKIMEVLLYYVLNVRILSKYFTVKVFRGNFYVILYYTTLSKWQTDYQLI